MDAWRGFEKGEWCNEIDVRDFIQHNYTPYFGDESFLEGSTENTKRLWTKILNLLHKETAKGGVLDADTSKISTITSHKPGYIDKELELIVGLQTDAPLKRSVLPYGGIRMVQKACEAYQYNLEDDINEIFTRFRKTQNDGIFDVYTPEMLRARKAGIITGLPDAYSRGRIIGDYRRVALYGIDKLLQWKKEEKSQIECDYMGEDTIRLREELSEQIMALKDLKVMAQSYGYDITNPATNAREAIQWLYFAYIGATKEQNGAAMSLGRVSSFLDIYIERDLRMNIITEKQAQELMEQFFIKLRIIRFLRTPAYDQLFSGDPVWITECIGGIGIDGRPLVTKNSFRILYTLQNLGPAPEPNMTVLWSLRLPDGFKRFCCRMSINSSSIQYENDDLMRPLFGDDYGIACCVSAMKLGKQMQFFGARVNFAKALLYAINGGKDEMNGKQVAPAFEPIVSEYLEFEIVMDRFEIIMDWLSRLYINTLNVIHYMHDKYNYERLQMAFHDRDIVRSMACGIAGLSVVVDSLSAIKYARVSQIKDKEGIAIDFKVEGEYPTFGNNIDEADDIGVMLVKKFMEKLRKHKTYRDSHTTLSILTITSNVVYGEYTGSTPDGRKKGEPFAPGANPMHGRDVRGALASMSSVAKIPYKHAEDGISYTFSVIPKALGKNDEDRENNLVGMLDGYFEQDAHHININVFEKETLLDAMEHPEKYPQLTIRVSGYAVNFIRLTREQQLDVINRTFHGQL